MGIQNFTSLLRRFAPTTLASSSVPLSQVSQTLAAAAETRPAIAVDALVFLRAFLHSQPHTLDMNSNNYADNNSISLRCDRRILTRTALLVRAFASLGVAPVFCFDNPAFRHEKKARETARRAACRGRSLDMLQIETSRLTVLQSLESVASLHLNAEYQRLSATETSPEVLRGDPIDVQPPTDSGVADVYAEILKISDLQSMTEQENESTVSTPTPPAMMMTDPELFLDVKPSFLNIASTLLEQPQTIESSADILSKTAQIAESDPETSKVPDLATTSVDSILEYNNVALSSSTAVLDSLDTQESTEVALSSSTTVLESLDTQTHRQRLQDLTASARQLSALAESLNLNGTTRQLFLETQPLLDTFDSLIDFPNTTQPTDLHAQLASLIARSQSQHASLSKRTQPLRTTTLRAVHDLLALLRVPVVHSAHEGEALCAFLTREGVTGASATEDMDACVFGEGIVLRGIAGAVFGAGISGIGKDDVVHGTVAAKRKGPVNPFDGEEGGVEEGLSEEEVAADDFGALSMWTRAHAVGGATVTRLDPAALRGEMGLTREQFVDLAILCGTDFSATLHRVGHVTAYKLIHEHGSIEAILAAGKYQPKDGFDYEGARDMFFNGLEDMEGAVDLLKVREGVVRFLEGVKAGGNGEVEVEGWNGVDEFIFERTLPAAWYESLKN